MKNLLKMGLMAIVFASCGKKAEVCMHNEVEIPCGYYNLYTEHSGIEAQINASFDDDVYLTFEEEYALRERWNEIYNNKKDSLTEAYNLVGAGDQLEFMAKMRVDEYEYYKKKKVKRAELKEFMSSLNIKAEESDTSAFGSEKPTLFWTVTNNSDKTITGFQIDKNIEVDGKIVSSSNVFYMFSASQITPTPEEDAEAVVLPGSSVFLSFDRPSQGEIKPEITNINFQDEE